MRIEHHIQSLGEPDQKISARAEALLIRHYGARAANELVQACSHQNPIVRLRAGWALAHTGDPRALSALLVLTEDADDCVRYDSTIALGIVGGPDALQHVVRLWMLQDESLPAAMALMRWGDEALKVAADALSHPSAAIRLDALAILGGIADPSANSLIQQHIDDPDPDVREEAKFQIGERPLNQRPQAGPSAQHDLKLDATIR